MTYSSALSICSCDFSFWVSKSEDALEERSSTDTNGGCCPDFGPLEVDSVWRTGLGLSMSS